MTYNLGDTQPSMVFEVNADMTGATVFGTYYRPDGTTTEVQCTVVVSDIVRDGRTWRITRITRPWSAGDLSVAGAGSLRLRWEAGADRGTLQPSSGWRVVVLPALASRRRSRW
jgi:hypothetical protein